MPPPFHVRTLDDYADWFAKQVEWFGGELDPALWVDVVADEDGNELAMQITRQLAWFTEVDMEFQVTVDRELNLIEYNFHCVTSDGTLIARYDMQRGHEAVGGAQDGLCHVHTLQGGEERIGPSDEMHIDDVLGAIGISRPENGG